MSNLWLIGSSSSGAFESLRAELGAQGHSSSAGPPAEAGAPPKGWAAWILLDVDACGTQAIDLAARARTAQPHAELLVLTEASGAELRRLVLAVRADGFIRKEAPGPMAARFNGYARGSVPLLPTNEAERLAQIDSALARDLQDKDFQDLANIAQVVCGTPIAAVSLVEWDQQRFCARAGPEVGEAPRDDAFCSYALRGQAVFEVEDASRDPRFAASSAVQGPTPIRFYAGAPLVGEGGCALGTVCVMDRRTRQLSDAQRSALQAVGRQAGRLLELRRLKLAKSP